ncbi:MAG: hypothetical protein MUC90_00140 [Thermoplasmata archaeon]|jgi:hypothetical protein|nr:hypothetical protein [Thermoplasmata archaeon]
MLKEEFRTHASYSGKGRFLTFPFFVFVLTLGFGLTLDTITETVPFSRLGLFTNLSAFLYGLSVGAFGLMGREYLERRYGRSNYLIAMPYLLPISFRTTFLGIYLRDALFYVLLLMAPAGFGLLAASPIAGFHLSSIGFFFLSVLVSFLIGLSLSFLASVVYIRNARAFVVITAAIAALFVSHGVFGVPSLEAIVPALGFQMNVPPFGEDYGEAVLYLAVSLAVSAVFVTLAYFLVQVRISISSRMYSDQLPKIHEKLGFVKGLSRSLLSKEFLDLRRSGVVTKMFFSFVLPLLFLSFTTWYVNYGMNIPVGFNAVFYAAMVGFIGVMMYNWLNNIDLAEYYSLLPVTVPQLIRMRIVVYLVLTSGISVFFVVAIAVLNGETELLWLAIVVMFITSVYMVVLTAYLTGLKTNTFLFDTSVLMKFSVMSFLPDVCLTILSFSLLSNWLVSVVGIALVLSSMGITTWVLFRGIESKWSKTPFYA